MTVIQKNQEKNKSLLILDQMINLSINNTVHNSKRNILATLTNNTLKNLNLLLNPF